MALGLNLLACDGGSKSTEPSGATVAAAPAAGEQAAAAQAATGEAKAEAENSGKPADIAEKIAEGKMRKFFEEVTLLGQKFVKDDTKSVSEFIPSGVTLTTFARVQLGAED